MRLLSPFLDFVEVDGVLYRLIGHAGGDLRARRISSRPSKGRLGGSPLYWPETLEEFHGLVETHSGLSVRYADRADADVFQGVARLVIENRIHATATGKRMDEYGLWHSYPDTSPGMFFGFRFTDGAKWYRSPVIEAQRAAYVVIPREWVPALQERYGFFAGRGGDIAGASP